MERTPVTDPELRTGGSEPAWTQLPQLNSGVCVCCLALAYFLVFEDIYLHAQLQRAGTEILFATDEWFAVAGNLNVEEPAVFDPNAFDSEGKLMDGCV